nr:tetratricopeptide repeat protein [Candidatus Burarchaeum sp.]
MEIDRQTSNLLKGVAIILIVLTHAIRTFQLPLIPFIGAASLGVFIFLFLSGYGIYRSYGLSGIDAKKYLSRRFRNVVVPYWAILTLYILGLLLFMPFFFTDPRIPTAIVLNYLLIVFHPYDILGVGWFVTYILMWYLIYLLVSRLPLGDMKKILLMLIGVPAVVYLFDHAIAQFLLSVFPEITADVLFNSRNLYLPYAFAFPLGVLASRRGSWTVTLHFRPLSKLGEYSYYLYLLHMGLLCLLLVNCFDTSYCANWNFVEINKYVSAGAEKISSGDYNGALADIDTILRINPYKEDAYLARGLAKYMLRDFQGALAAFDRAIELNPLYAEAYLNRGTAKWALKDYAGAIQDYDLVLKFQPGSAVAYFYRGSAQEGIGNITGAIADFDKAVNSDPKYIDAYLHRAQSKLLIGDYEGMRKDVDSLPETDPANNNRFAALFSQYGDALSGSGKYDRAIEAYGLALEFLPNSAVIYGKLGAAKGTQGDYAGAIADLDKAIELDPKLAEAYYNRGGTKYMLGDFEGAEADINKAHELNPALPDYDAIKLQMGVQG